MKRKLKLDLERCSDTLLITKAKIFLAAMINNRFFPEPHPFYVEPLAKVGETTASLEKSYLEALSGDKYKIATRKNFRRELIAQLTDWAEYVQLVAKGDPEKLASSGFDLRKEPGTSTVKAGYDDLVPILDMRHGGERGMVIAWTKSHPRAASYEIHIAIGDPTIEQNWKHAAVFGSCKEMVLGGLQPGQDCSFRLRYILSDGVGPWSHPYPFMPT